MRAPNCPVCDKYVVDDGKNTVFNIKRNGVEAKVRIHHACGTTEEKLDFVRAALKLVTGRHH